MAKRPLVKMPNNIRAKQFRPFAALGGFSEACDDILNERNICHKRILSDDELAMLDIKFASLKRGQTICLLVSMENGERLIEDIFVSIDKNQVKLNKQNIDISDILDVY